MEVVHGPGGPGPDEQLVVLVIGLRSPMMVLLLHMARGLPVGEVQDQVTWVGVELQVSERDEDPGGVC